MAETARKATSGGRQRTERSGRRSPAGRFSIASVLDERGAILVVVVAEEIIMS